MEKYTIRSIVCEASYFADKYHIYILVSSVDFVCH